jgi:hypothetical protein
MDNTGGTLEISVARARGGLFAAPQGHSGRWLILDQKKARYIVLPEAAGKMLAWLVAQPLGATSAELRTLWPTVDVVRLEALGLVDLVSPLGRPPKALLIVEFYVVNLAARICFALFGWRAIASLMPRSTTEYTGRMRSARPLLFDEIEVAAQAAMCLPGTRRLCTIIALTCALMLRWRGFSADIVVMSTSDLPNPHAFVVVGSHRIDPAEEQVSGPLLQPMYSCELFQKP